MRITPKSLVILAVVVSITYIGFVVLAILIPESQEFVTEILPHPYTFIFIISIVLSVITYEDYQLRKKVQQALDEQETRYQGPIKEKLLYRELDGWEKQLLEQKYKQTKEQKYDLDRRSPVFRIQGRLVKLSPTANGNIKIQEEWTVRGFTINADNFPDIRYKGFREGEELQVEFSPFSSWAWDVFRVVDGKRKWLLNVEHNNFKLLKSGLLKALVRAPFGTHQLERMQTGEYLTLTDMGSGEIKEVKIAYVKKYPNLTMLLTSEGVVNICPTVKTIPEAEAIINTYTDYEKRIAEGGVYAIGIEYLN